MKICVVGCGYVGLATTVAISKKQNVTIYDIDSNKLDCLRKDLLPIDDDDLKELKGSKFSKCNWQKTVITFKPKQPLESSNFDIDVKLVC